ncbi:large ribosomal subunit protein bL19cy-like [Magnolia sinica]|uniref:large ribosomal subunit protein bL19cy-like n=1 Tax=Magnolia sinica TaxID=86752 RepID=UPI00265B4C57|nr:large ribosomal subunit protein bL19cy-like [Magnolia sinica]
MGSTILPQALISIPRTLPHSSKLGFPVLSSLPRFSSAISPCIIQPRKRSFVVKAELNSEEETAEEIAEEENSEETGSDPEIPDAEEEERPQRKPRVKLGDIMGILNKRAVEAAEKEHPVPDLRTGDIVEVKLEVPENRRRASIYKGIVISKQNAGIHTTIRIRRIIAGIGVEIVFPVYSPNIKEIKVVKHRKVRRARLYYLRDKLPRLSTFK